MDHWSKPIAARAGDADRFPGQRCAVSLASTHDRLAVAPDGTLVVEPVTHLGLAYDHRFCTDRDAVAVLSSLKAAIEAPERLAGR
jgi:2-oxoglutarate dehydrogenase E2 component (dihydrolipoamide succinyltransferase)